MAKADLYATLDVERDADSDAIRKAFRKLARKYHPDVNQNDPKKAQKAEERSRIFRLLSRASQGADMGMCAAWN